jgi:hypothetical protein
MNQLAGLITGEPAFLPCLSYKAINVTFVPFLLVSSAVYFPDIVPFTGVYT